MQTDKLPRFPDWQTAMLADKLTRLPDCQTDNGQADRRIQLVKLPCRLTNWQGFPTDKLSCCQTDKWTSLQGRLPDLLQKLSFWLTDKLVQWTDKRPCCHTSKRIRRPLTFSALTFSCTENAFKSFNVTCSSWPIFYLPHTTRTYRTSMLICGQQCAQRWGTYTYTYIHDFQQYSTSAYGMSIRGQQYE